METLNQNLEVSVNTVINYKSIANKAIHNEVRSLSGAIKLFNQYRNLPEVKQYLQQIGAKLSATAVTPVFVVNNWKAKNENGECTRKLKGEIVLKTSWSVYDILTAIKNSTNINN